MQLTATLAAINMLVVSPRRTREGQLRRRIHALGATGAAPFSNATCTLYGARRSVIESPGMMLLLQIAGLASTLFGTLFLWYDTERLATLIQPERHTLTNDPKWKAWRYNKSELGFKLLFIAIVLQALSLAVSEYR